MPIHRGSGHKSPQMYIKKLHFSQIGSTHQYAIQGMTEWDKKAWTAISADSQSDGRGQGLHTWSDLPGHAALFSLVSPVVAWTSLEVMLRHKAVACAVLAVTQATTHARILLKWPNDLYQGQYKLGGILTEAQWSGAFCHRLVCSVGVYVSNGPTETAYLGKNLSASKVRAACIDAIVGAVEGDLAAIPSEFDRNLLHQGTSLWRRPDQQDAEMAECLGVDAHGQIGLKWALTDSSQWYPHGAVKWEG